MKKAKFDALEGFYKTKVAAEVAAIDTAIHAVMLLGDLTESDGLGGQFTDEDNGSDDTFTSADGRTWYRSADISANRLTPQLDRNLLKRHPATQSLVFLGDMQPVTVTQKARVDLLLADIKANYAASAAMLINVGDVVDTGDSSRPPEYGAVPYTMKDMYEAHRLSGIPEEDWFVIPGNHDIDYNNNSTDTAFNSGSNPQYAASYRTYLTWFQRHFYYVVRGNLVLIFIGAQARNTAGNITDDVVGWCKEIVRCNQGRTIGIVTHHPLQNTVAGSTTVGGSQLESSRFLDWIGTAGHRVDFWFSRHSGGDLNNPEVESHKLIQGCMFVGVDMNSSVDLEGDPGTITGLGSSYVVIEMVHGSNVLTFKRRNIDTASVSKEWSITVSSKMELSDRYTFDGRYQYDERHGIMTVPQIITTNLRRELVGDAWQPIHRPHTVLTLDLRDSQNDDVGIGEGASMVCRVPGANTRSSGNNEPNLNRPSRFGARFGAVRTNNGETFFSAAARISYSSGGVDAFPGYSESNEVPVIDFAQTYAKLLVSGYTVRMQHSTAGVIGLGIAQDTRGTSAIFYPRGAGGGTNYNAANTILQVGITAVGRSINAGGTINASGADYAEYKEIKPHLYGSVPKGTALGVAADGLLTDRFSEVVGRVFFKSTAPNLVGNDSWGTEKRIMEIYGIEAVGNQPIKQEAVVDDPKIPDDMPNQVAIELLEEASRKRQEIQAALDTRYEEEMTAWNTRREVFTAALEQERIKYDRIALCGVVPVNIQGVTEDDIGRYVVPEAGPEDSISFRLVTKTELSLMDYINACAVIEGIHDDGRPVVSVKVN